MNAKLAVENVLHLKLTSVLRIFEGEHNTPTSTAGFDDNSAASQGEPILSLIKVDLK